MQKKSLISHLQNSPLKFIRPLPRQFPSLSPSDQFARMLSIQRQLARKSLLMDCFPMPSNSLDLAPKEEWNERIKSNHVQSTLSPDTHCTVQSSKRAFYCSLLILSSSQRLCGRKISHYQRVITIYIINVSARHTNFTKLMTLSAKIWGNRQPMWWLLAISYQHAPSAF